MARRKYANRETRSELIASWLIVYINNKKKVLGEGESGKGHKSWGHLLHHLSYVYPTDNYYFLHVYFFLMYL